MLTDAADCLAEEEDIPRLAELMEALFTRYDDSRYHYRKIHDARILPTFEVVAIPTARAHAYGLLRTILSDAVQRRLIDQDAGRSSVPATPSVRSGLGRPATLPQPEARPR